MDLNCASETAWCYRHVGAYLPWVRSCFAATAAGHMVRTGWCNPPLDEHGFRQDFREALHRRINLKAGPQPKWRNLDPESQTRLVRDRRRLVEIITMRVRHYSFETDIVRRQFGHLLAKRDD